MVTLLMHRQICFNNKQPLLIFSRVHICRGIMRVITGVYFSTGMNPMSLYLILAPSRTWLIYTVSKLIQTAPIRGIVTNHIHKEGEMCQKIRDSYEAWKGNMIVRPIVILHYSWWIKSQPLTKRQSLHIYLSYSFLFLVFFRRLINKADVENLL